MKKIPADIFQDVDRKDVERAITAQGYEAYCLKEKDIRHLILKRDAAAHKGIFGHALIIAGSEGRAGAAILACKAVLRTGCGLVTGLIPASATGPLLSALPEAMSIVRNDEADSKIDLTGFQSIGFGPGVGMKAGTLLLQLFENYRQPMVIDADGLTLLSQNPGWYHLLTPDMILTPHPGEFDRLTKKHASVFERFKTQLQFSKTYGVNVLLKGRHTSITTHDAKIYFNTTGNSGMATAGSGDVLTGIITSLLAQGYPAETAAVLGAYLHGFAGDIMAEERSETSLIASDIIDGIGAFFNDFEK
jgi:hydroxyethylthiazole kinase-like uncharacterized protein yjeF